MLSLSKLKSGRQRGESTAAKGVVARGVTALGAVFVSSFLAVSAQAFPALNLTPGSPDIFSDFIEVTYSGDNDSGVLSAVGEAVELQVLGQPARDIDNGSFVIDADIGFNSLSAAGSLVIGGDIADLGISGTLLTGTLDTFGAGSDDPLEFLFTVDGGELAALYGGIGAQAGVILSSSGYTGSFAGDFSNIGLGLSDTFGSVPLPGTIWLMLSGAGLMLFRQRRSGKAIA